ncbi:hypothetical protein KKF64_02265 [Patescibacteria group bacterium]|nr:hypothetical protein [Patescibacteria group bacterium]
MQESEQRKTPTQLREEQKIVKETEDLSEMFTEEMLETEDGPPTEEDIKTLLEMGGENSKKEKLTPERMKQAWDKLSDVEKKFILTTSDKVFEKIIAKSPDKQKTLIMSGLRKLIKNNDPRAAKIERKII